MKRSIQSKQSSTSAPPTSPRAEKRQKLRIKHRNNQLLQLWRVVVCSSITYGLGVLVIKNGWSLIDVEQITVQGSSKIQAASIISASGFSFPKPLFAINPKQLKINLLKELPIRSLQIERRLFPPKLTIIIQERKPVAFADRRGIEGKEKGMLDKNGNWMPIRMAPKTDLPLSNVYVEGWVETQKNLISILLENKDKLGSPLTKIILSPNGEISLKTKKFQVVQLGASNLPIKKQIKALYQLSINLPAKLVNKKNIILDIRDPSKPELQIPNNDL